MQWNEAGNAWGSQNRSGCARADTTCCFLFGSAPAVKKPMHPAQQRCESALMPLPPAPPWPATPPAGAKNILHVLVDDLLPVLDPSRARRPEQVFDTGLAFSRAARPSEA